MPSKTTIFNNRAVATHSFALAPRNTISFSPHGRFVIVAGFGNLAGQMDIYDVEKDYKKMTTIEASDASVCEWSPDGKHILTATTSPRLRVDNGVRIWHVGGGLMYNEDMNELYDVHWRPQSTTQHPLEDPLHPMPNPHPSALEYLKTKKIPSKPVGAYRPPGARGQSTPMAFRREDQGGKAYVRDETTAGFASSINGYGKSKRRGVPGAEPAGEFLPPGAAPGGGVTIAPGAESPEDRLSKSAAKNKKKREAKKIKEAADKAAGEGGDSRDRRTLDPNSYSRQNRDRSRSRSAHRRQRSEHNNQPRQQQGQGRQNGARGNANQQAPTPAPAAAAPDARDVTVTEAEEAVNPAQDKKVRGLLKKLRAIEDLKMRVAGDEKLEDTQVKKIQTEEDVRKDLEKLGWTD